MNKKATSMLMKAIIGLILAVLIAFVHLYLGSIFLVSGGSMLSALESGNIVWVNKLAYLRALPSRGDIVVLKYPGDPDSRKFVKRIIGLPGEMVEIKNSDVYINKTRLTEAYLDENVVTEPDLKLVLKPNEYYTVGDNRTNSSDSRGFGPTAQRFLIGRVKLRLWPVKSFGYFPETFY